MFHLTSKLLNYSPDKDFPEQYMDDKKNKLLKCKKVNIASMMSMVDCVHDHIMKDSLSPSACTSLLKHNGFNIETIKVILQKSNNIKRLTEAGTDKLLFNAIKEEQKEDPDAFTKYERPFIWSWLRNIDTFVEVPMHLLFLGIVKSVLTDVVSWMNTRRNHAEFIRMADGVLEPLTLFKLEWCKIQAYKQGTFGGYVSEDFLGLSRVSLWFYSMIFQLQEKKYEDPVTHCSKWKKQTCINWFQARGLAYTKTNSVKIMREEIKTYFVNDNVPDIITNNICNKETVLSVIYVMNRMIELCMQHNCHEERIVSQRLECVIRCFLLLYDRMDMTINTKKQPSWISSYNFLSLLNIPQAMNRHGSMRNIWEGGLDGEGILKFVKQELQCGLVREWQTWTLDNLLKKDALKEIMNNNNIENDEDKIIKPSNYFKVYASKEKIKESMEEHLPISAMRYPVYHQQLSDIYVCYREDKEIFSIKIQRVPKSTVTYNHLNYFNIFFEDESKVALGHRLEGEVIGILLLPILSPPKNVNMAQKYCVVSSDWNEYK